MNKIIKVLLLVLYGYISSCNVYKNKIIGRWEQVIISDEILSIEQMKVMKVDEPTVNSYSKLGEYIGDFGDYKDKDLYRITSDTLIYELSGVKFKIDKLKRDIMILKYTNSPSYIYYRRIN